MRRRRLKWPKPGRHRCPPWLSTRLVMARRAAGGAKCDGHGPELIHGVGVKKNSNTDRASHILEYTKSHRRDTNGQQRAINETAQ